MLVVILKQAVGGLKAFHSAAQTESADPQSSTTEKQPRKRARRHPINFALTPWLGSVAPDVNVRVPECFFEV